MILVLFIIPSPPPGFFRAAIEYEKKGYAENYEHGQVMEKKLIAMAREMEKLRAEIANAEKRARAAAAVSNPGNLLLFQIQRVYDYEKYLRNVYTYNDMEKEGIIKSKKCLQTLSFL